MSIDLFIDALIKREGGYVNDPADRGGETKYGITKATALENGYKHSMRDLPIEKAKEIYISEYWIKPCFDQINLLSPLVAEKLLDIGVNSGANFAKPLLQKALNLQSNQGKLYPCLTVDGVYGARTLTALQTFLKLRGKEGEKVLFKMLNVYQGYHYISITEKNSSQSKFIYGWFNNRVA